MKAPPLPPCHDLVRLCRPTLEETISVLLEHLKRKPPTWSYMKARALSPFAFSHEVAISALKQACDTVKLESARNANWEVVQLIREASKGRVVRCHGMSDGRLPIRSDLSIKVAADFYFVENKRLKVFWLQPRRSYALNNKQLGMFGSLVKSTLLIDGFADADLEILDLSASEKVRAPKTLSLNDLPHISEVEMAEAVQRVVSAYDTILAMDIDWASVRGRAAKKDKPSAQEGFSF